jgi:hypothetical protein
MTLMFDTPNSFKNSTMPSTTSGWVVAPLLGGCGVTRLGLMATLYCGFTHLFMSEAAKASRVIFTQSVP